ncbi:hypothetical protein L4D06_12470 [Enterovibrio makurazakiensis]|uniref:hypothetical protein n=1 Tax=Enterovibrio makurazakiensis TaxID=2910232 RepID=UPI003D1E44F6
MKRLVVAVLVGSIIPMAAMAAKGGNGSTPNGKPFQHIQGQVADLQSQIDSLVGRVDSLEGHAVAVDDAIATLQLETQDLQAQINSTNGDVSDLQSEVDQNGILIAALEAQQTQLAQQLDMKQNVIDGLCPDGTAIKAVNNDGSVVCSDASGGLDDLDRVIAYSSNYYYANATCPSGFTLTGGGFSIGYYNQLRNSYPSGNTWHVYANYNYYYSNVYAYAVCVRGTGSTNWQYVYY